MWTFAALVPVLSFSFSLQSVFVVLMATAGAAVVMMALAAFRHASTTSDPTNPRQASALVTYGIYRYTRNPMYLGMTLIQLAFFIYLGNVAALIPIVFFVLYISRFQIIPEERALESLFNDEYNTYRSTVRRWI